MIISVLIIKQFLFFYEIDNYKCNTFGTIQYTTENLRSISLHYRYIVNDKEYIGNTSVRNFSKIKDELICKNCNFKVYYSSKDPSKSSLRLGKYEKYKTKVEFVNLDD
ncbi:MAG TPA: hypothetical protein VK164_09925 [Flavobacterium sp.]|uniref:hypothetical protein n=1 Tax=Flavobacterium sp. TaxID=239 RepID=UPI002B4B1D36|nr:hypothetical protein [Flavobacterium sp.]HLO74240.1 hypothetical protein [Flavobacterium sp.]